MERPAFISSAELLGLALEDIRDLLDVPDGGGTVTCPPADPGPDAREGGGPWREAPVACPPGGDELGERTAQWRALVARATEHQEVPDGCA